MIYEKSCGAVIYDSEYNVLIVKHNAGHWDFPKGHVEPGETEEETAIREVKEETNVDIEIIPGYRYETHYSPKEGYEKTVVFFLARYKGSDTQRQECEIAEIDWFDHEDALEVITYDNARELYEKTYEDIVML